MAASMVNEVLASGRYHDVLSILKGLRNGAVYGVKIRAPHALVMTFLFGSGSLRNKLRVIFKATYTHSKNLASFVFLYKTILVIMRWLEGKQEGAHSLLAGFIGGYIVFGENNKVNSQINMYLLSRILFGAARMARDKGLIPDPKVDVFPLFAALVWAIVMWQFETNQSVLQQSLQNSMTYLYHDSNVWHGISDFLWRNKPGQI
ncbi:peroxisomal membrane protein 4 [Strongylocentrotus purpuratus]|uniref:Peroxisomal membrane protein 4 n=1 Tax=Strongylocentrotus purpuratus TaxID=7668 RepID=A0A7M7RFL5_STRPU|nr:peroxisomal membrane protein 4 [Strongylocentrotus purpuratus]|eukprot:XP_799176.1 PREDICTED: peroxisomal membrane protein 4 [Strongylocentrotus purpuratus]